MWVYSTRGGPFRIEKWRGPNFYVGGLRLQYVSAGEINGKPAIFVRRTLMPPEYQPSAGTPTLWFSPGIVIIPEEFGFTMVRVDGIKIPFEEAVKIAEGLE